MTQHQQGGAYAWLVWVLGVAFVVFLFAVQTGYAIINPDIKSSLTLSYIQIGLIASIYTWVFAISQFFGGALLDLLGARKVLTISLCLVTIGVFTFAHADHFYWIIIAQCFLALGSCTGFVGAGFIGEQWFGGAKFSFMFGLVQLVVALSSAFTQNLFGFALEKMSWNHLYDCMGVFGIVLIILYVFFMRDHHLFYKKQKHPLKALLSNFAQDLKAVAKVAHVWMAAIGGGLTFSVILALGVVWGPKLMLSHGVDQTSAILATSLIWLGLAVGSPVITYLSDKLQSRKKIIVIGNIVQLCCLGIILLVPITHASVLMLLFFIFGLCNAAHMLAFSSAADVVAEQYIGTSSSIVNGLMFIFGGIMMAIPAMLVGTPSQWNLSIALTGFYPLLLGLLLAVIVALCMKETYPKK